MSVKKDASGHRSVEVEVEVPGTPEEVWAAIATGRGVTSWFVPTTIEEKVGGEIVATFGPGMDSRAKISAWEPPHRFTADNPGGMGPDSPAMATEWTVEARGGGTCLVRVVHRWFAETDDWDAQYGNVEQGWPAFFRILRLHLTHFRGMGALPVQLMGFAPKPTADAWAALKSSLGFGGAAVGQKVKSAAGVPPMSGIVERLVDDDKNPEMLLRLEEPAPGVAHVFAMGMGGQVYVAINCFLYGDRAAAVIVRDEPAWQAWMAQHFPVAMGSSATT
jgi:uncharacterized protein YndB with AHSA1/START domain